MRVLLLLTMLARFAPAGTVKGIVLENASGRPLSRTSIRLDPVPGTQGMASAVRSGPRGEFLFEKIAPGQYLLTAYRGGYFPLGYGQRIPSGHGAPITVTEDSALFAELRMRHQGAITGRVLDENGVGASGVQVIAYRARLPLRSAGSGRSDDRGVYRIAGLEPGKYWIRSRSHALEDGSAWLPTFSSQSRDPRDAKIFAVTVEDEAAYADVSPEPGPLFQISGEITCQKSGNVQVTLHSQTGEYGAQTFCGPSPGSYQFENLAAGEYELFAAQQDTLATAFLEFSVQRSAKINLSLADPPPVLFTVTVGGIQSNIPVSVFGRRQNLSSNTQTVEIRGSRVPLAPGYWEFRAQPPPGYYLESIASPRGTPQRRASPGVSAAEWFEVFITDRSVPRVQINISSGPAEVAGRVLDKSVPVSGAPVYLWPESETTRRALGGSVQTVSAMDGSYRFAGLPPGAYRVLASFDVLAMDQDMAEMSRPARIQLEAGRSAVVDLTLWLAGY